VTTSPKSTSPKTSTTDAPSALDVLTFGQLRSELADVPDPEVPVVTVQDLGILRDVVRTGERQVLVVITPTYSGCPAMDAIRDRLEHVARRSGWTASVQTRLSPPWTTDWMTSRGRDRLREFGIAPPGPVGTGSLVEHGPVVLGLSVRRVSCPLCGSADTEELARFGSTACKALRRCLSCREPFDEFKAL